MKILDCTLRDGGYVNNWRFGKERISGIIAGLESVNVDILELGFLRDEGFDPDRTSFSSIESVNRLVSQKKEGVLYSVMIEAFNPFPLDKLRKHLNNGIDLVRICIWKRFLEEHMDYCKKIAEKGYKVSIQPSRVESYDDASFVHMCKLSNELNPYAVYVVDTWGTQSRDQICHYARLADEHLKPNIILGYHGHNNKMQALGCVQALLDMNLNRELSFDSSIFGMGRGAGNLHTEILSQYLNERYGQQYNELVVIRLFQQYIKQFYNENPWGYSSYYFMSAEFNCNPNYATYFAAKKYSEDLFERFLKSLSDQEKILFDTAFAEKRITKLNQ